MSENGNLPSSSREMRNRAEKQRRDKLNAYISELYSLVPSAASAPRKLDKTSTLRLSANFLRIHQNIDLRTKPYSRWSAHTGHLILEKLDSFLLAVSCSTGKILYVSDRVEKLLGHAQVDMMGHQLSYFVHQSDQETIEKQFSSFAYQVSRDSDEETTAATGQVFTFECRLATRQLSRGEPTVYETCLVSGKFRGPRRRHDLADIRNQAKGSSANGHLTEPLFIAIVRLLQTPFTLPPLTVVQAAQDEYFTEHTPDGTIMRADHRIAIVAGYLTAEVTRTSAFHYMHPEDVDCALKAQSLMFSKNEGMVTYRLKMSTGKYIYLRSRGFLQYDDVTKELKGFFCINSQLSDEEGKKQMQSLRKMLENLSIGAVQHPAIASSPINEAPPPRAPSTSTPRRNNNGCVNQSNGKIQRGFKGRNGLNTPSSPGCSSELMYSPASDCSSSSSCYGGIEEPSSTNTIAAASTNNEIGFLALSYIPIPFPWQPATAPNGSIQQQQQQQTTLITHSATAENLGIHHDVNYEQWKSPENKSFVLHHGTTVSLHHQQPLVAILHENSGTTSMNGYHHVTTNRVTEEDNNSSAGLIFNSTLVNYLDPKQCSSTQGLNDDQSYNNSN